MRQIEEIKDDVKLLIDELQKRVKREIEQDLYDDIYLFYRFLKARDFNINNAEDMLRKHIQWRKKYDVRNILTWKMPEVVEKYSIYALVGFDKEGCPIRYSPVGNVDFIGIISSLKFEDREKAIIYYSESDTKILGGQSEKFKKNIDKFIYIADLKNLSFAQATNKRSIFLLIYFINMYVNNYPERLKTFYIINAPAYFSAVYSLLKTLMPSIIVDRIRIYSNETYKKDFLKVANADELPVFLGGNRTDPDDIIKFNQAAWPVPERYFIHRRKQCLSKLPGVQKIILSRAAFQEVNLDVIEPGSYLEWEFENKFRDIGFGVFLSEMVNDEKKMTELVPIQRIDTAGHSQKGTLKCELPGKYVVVFDNTYSWIRAKEIYYRVKIVSPEKYDADLNKNDISNEVLLHM